MASMLDSLAVCPICKGNKNLLQPNIQTKKNAMQEKVLKLNKVCTSRKLSHLQSQPTSSHRNMHTHIQCFVSDSDTDMLHRADRVNITISVTTNKPQNYIKIQQKVNNTPNLVFVDKTSLTHKKSTWRDRSSTMTGYSTDKPNLVQPG